MPSGVRVTQYNDTSQGQSSFTPSENIDLFALRLEIANYLKTFDFTPYLPKQKRLEDILNVDYQTSSVYPGQPFAVGILEKAARADHVHGSPNWGPVNASFVGQESYNGVSGDFSRSDHSHGSPQASYGSITQEITFGTLKYDGVDPRAARSDHMHGNPSFPYSVAGVGLAVGGITVTGYSSLVSRQDHTHALVSYGPPVAVGSQNFIGSQDQFSRSDHVHQFNLDAIPYANTVVQETAYNQQPVAGNASSFSRGDHTHGTPPDADLVHKTLVETLVGQKTFVSATTRFTDQVAPSAVSPYGAKSVLVFGSGLGVLGGTSTDTLNVTGQSTFAALSASSLNASVGTVGTLTTTNLAVSGSFTGSVIASSNIIDGTIQDVDVAGRSLTQRVIAFDTITGGSQSGEGNIAGGTIQQYNLATNITAPAPDNSVTGGPAGTGVKIKQGTITRHNVYSKTLRNSEMINGGMGLDDPSFRWSALGTSDSPWLLNTGWTIVELVGRDGGNAAQKVGGTDAPLSNGFAFDASAGDVYSASCWSKSGTVAPNGTITCKIAWYSDGNAFISYGTEFVSVATGASTNYTQIQTVSQAPANTAYGRVQAVPSNHTVGIYLVDEFAMARSIGTNQLLDGAVTVLKLADRAVSTVKMQIASVTDQILADLSVDTAALQDAAVTLQKMAQNSVSNAQLVASSIVASQKIVPGSITSELLASGVQVSNVADGAVNNKSITTGQVFGAVPPVNAPADSVANIAQRTIAAVNIVQNTITGNEITASTLTLAGNLVVQGTTQFNSAVTTASGVPFTVNGALSGQSGSFSQALSAVTGTFSGDITAGGFVQGRSGGGVGIAFKVGNDFTLADTDLANTVLLQGAQDPLQASLKFGTGGQTFTGSASGFTMSGSTFTVGGSQVIRQVDAAGTTTSGTSYAAATTPGVALTYSRGDHAHGTPPTPVTSLITSGNLSLTGSTGALTLSFSSNPTFNNVSYVGYADFGSQNRQMVNLFGTAYALGVQASTSYGRSAGGYAWFKGGVHSDNQNDPGAGGTLMMRLDASGNLFIPGNFTFQSGSGTSSQLQPDASYVHIAGTETITGPKIMSSQITLNAGALLPSNVAVSFPNSSVLQNSTTTLDIRGASSGVRVMNNAYNVALMSILDTGATTINGTLNTTGALNAQSNVLVGTGAGRQQLSDDGVYAYHQSDRDIVFSPIGGGIQRLRLSTVGDAILAGSLTVNGSNLSGSGVDRHSYGLRSHTAVTGGGTITLSANFDLSWSQRLIVINTGSGTNTSTSGYHDITMPIVGTQIQGVGGAATVTVSASGISMAGDAAVVVANVTTTPAQPWVALWYILPVGGTAATNNSNFRISAYTAAFTPPSDWILIANKNGDTGTIRLCTGQYLTAGKSADNSQASVTNDAAYVHIQGTETISGAKTFNAVTTFNSAITFPVSQFGGVVSEQSYGLASSPGTAIQFSRSDHTHGSVPALPWNLISAKPANWLTQALLTGVQSDFSNSFNSMANRTSGFFQVDSSNTAGPDTTLAYTALQVRKQDASVNIGMQLTMATTNNDLYVRSFSGGNGTDGSGTFQPWAKVWSTYNLQPVTLDTAQTIIGVKTFSTMPVFAGTSATNYTTASIQAYYNGSGSRPRVAFHMAGVVASQLAMDSDGHFTFADNPGTGRAGARASFLDASTTVNVGTVLQGRGLEAINVGDSYLRINQSNTFTSGIWFGSSPLRGGGGGMYLGSSGGDGQIALIPNTADTVRRITLDGGTGNLTIAGSLSVGTLVLNNPRINDTPLYYRGGGDTANYTQYNATIDGPILAGNSGVGFYRNSGGFLQLGRFDVNGNLYLAGSVYPSNGNSTLIQTNSLYATGSITAGNGAVTIGASGITASAFSINTNGYAYFSGSLESGPSGTNRIRIYNDTSTGSDRDAVQFISSGNVVTSEIRGNMGVGGRGLYLNSDTQIGATSSVIYQVGKRQAKSPGSDIRIRANSFSGTSSASGTLAVSFGTGMSQAPEVVVVTLTSTGSQAYVYWVTGVSASGFTINVRYGNNTVPGSGSAVSGYYYAEIVV